MSHSPLNIVVIIISFNKPSYGSDVPSETYPPHSPIQKHLEFT